MRWAFLVVTLLFGAAYAFAAEMPPASTGLGAPMPTVDYLLTLGPYGALVWGAYLLGKGLKVTVVVELSERDRELVEKFGKGAA